MSNRINSPESLSQLRNSLKDSSSAKDLEGGQVKIRVSMATCGIASGAKEIERFFQTELKKRSIGAEIIPVGCMGYCYAEPTIEVTVPNREPVVFGYVDLKKADDIIESYIRNNEMPEGIIPVNYDLP